MSIKQSYSLSEIAEWQTNDTGDINLPDIQRGFVWKSSQIENLWDSILRGYPIGAFSMSSEGHLYDGQQRSTAIALGFYNHWKSEKSNFWKIKHIPNIWIDLQPAKNYNGREFLIRVCTQSHPWGYSDTDNTKTLELKERRAALELFEHIPENKNKNYTSYNLKNTFPYDSNCPVPLAFLLDIILEKNITDPEYIKDELGKMIIQNGLKEKLASRWNNLHTGTDEKQFEDIIDAIKNINKLFVPIIKIDTKLLKKEAISTEIEADNEDQEANQQEDPTLFIRLNSAGTRIEGEELIYSMFKAEFKDLHQITEEDNPLNKFITPSRIVTLCSRLIFSDLDNDNYPTPINIGDFSKRYLKKTGFDEALKRFISQDMKPLFEQVIHIFENQLPHILIKRLLQHNPEILLLLFKWLRQNNHQSINNKQIAGHFMALCWFCENKYKKYYVQNVWGKINLDGVNFWQSISVNIERKTNYIMPVLLYPEILKNNLIKSVVEERKRYDDIDAINEVSNFIEHLLALTEKNKDSKKEKIEQSFDLFLNQLLDNKEFLLFAQKEYLTNKFLDFNQLDNLEDTNTPWDWDHIYPSSYIYGSKKKKKNRDARVTDWHWTIGNFRILALSDNRSESDHLSPAERLINHWNLFSITEDNWKHWQKLEANEYNEKEVNIFLTAVIERICNIYAEWYKSFDIGNLNSVITKKSN